MRPSSKLKRESFTGAEAQVFHCCIDQELGARGSDYRHKSTTPPVPLERRRQIAQYAEQVASLPAEEVQS